MSFWGHGVLQQPETVTPPSYQKLIDTFQKIRLVRQDVTVLNFQLSLRVKKQQLVSWSHFFSKKTRTIFSKLCMKLDIDEESHRTDFSKNILLKESRKKRGFCEFFNFSQKLQQRCLPNLVRMQSIVCWSICKKITKTLKRIE